MKNKSRIPNACGEVGTQIKSQYTFSMGSEDIISLRSAKKPRSPGSPHFFIFPRRDADQRATRPGEKAAARRISPPNMEAMPFGSVLLRSR